MIYLIPKIHIYVFLEGLGMDNVDTLVCMYILYIMDEVGVFYGVFGIHAYFVVIGYIFPRFGLFHQEKSGNPGNLTMAV
jgi:hypothetical protein